MSIHPTAIVDPGAELGRDVHIGAFALIERDVRIGDRCTIGPRVSILQGTTLGSGCRVHTGAVLGDLPQDVAFKGQVSSVRIGNDCWIREYVTIHRGTKEETVTEVGNGCLLMGLSHLAHNVRLGQQVVVVNGALLAGYVEVGDRAFISGNVAIHQFVRIGRLAMIGGGAGVSQDVPPFCTVRPMMANAVMGLNIVGLRRAGFTPAQRHAIKQAFVLLFRSRLNVRDALVRIRAEIPDDPLVREMADFAGASKRGICRLYSGAVEPEGAESS